MVEALYAGAKVMFRIALAPQRNKLVTVGMDGIRSKHSDSLINAINENIINSKKIIPFHEFEKYKLSNVSKVILKVHLKKILFIF